MIAATIVARNYLAQARVVAATFLDHHPGAQFVTLVIDGDESDRTAGLAGTVCLPADLGLPEGEWEQMAGVYTVLELATGLKAALLTHLLAIQPGDTAGAVCYLDPDIVVYQPFPEAFDVAERAGIALTPHVLNPLPRDGLKPDERALMHAGLFNLGFICVGPQAAPFLDWWHERLRLDSVVDLPNALFTDQRWIDWVPSLFGAAVLRDPGLNVAYWNAHERPLTRGDDGVVEAAGEPLKFFHFSGYDPDQPWRLSKHPVERPRCRLVDLPVVAELCDAYGHALRAAGLADQRHLRYGFDETVVGIQLTSVVRGAYRAGVLAALSAGTPVPPAPFAADGGVAFAAWLTAPAFGPPDLELCEWHRQVWRMRGDLQAAFGDPGGADALRFHRWLTDDPGARQLRDEIGLPPVDGRTAAAAGAGVGAAVGAQARERVDYGWNVVGYFSAELGVGEAGRRMSTAIEHAGLRTELVAITADASRNAHSMRRPLRSELLYRDTVYCVNADQLAGAMARAGDRSGGGRRIGLWFWEVERFPREWHAAFDLLDEVWCSSTFTTNVLAAVSPVPVRTVPLPVSAPSSPTPFTRHQLGLPDGFVFLFTYDFNSVVGRKNPFGLIDAYERAFGPDDGATLVLKSINGYVHPHDLDRVRHASRGRPDIIVRDGYVDAHQVQGMVELCDAFVSLHRAEGFGLGLATAMAAARPVIATAYSGNLDFMDERSALLVPYDLVPIGAGMGPYPVDARWAEPDRDAAATHMRTVFDDPSRARHIGERGRDHVLACQSLDRSSAEVARSLLVGVPA